jgi:hypothetical protein
VRNFDHQELLVEYSEFDFSDIPDHWVDYFLFELSETGEDLPGKSLQQRISKADFRKLKAARFIKKPNDSEKLYREADLQIQSVFSDSDPGIPIPGYYSSLSLLYVF